MNLIQYIAEVKKFELDEDIVILVKHLESWLDDDYDLEYLVRTVDKLFGNLWFQRRETHDHLYQLWCTFKVEAVDSVGGMTMNERLYLFGLFNRMDNCKSTSEIEKIYKKLEAKISQ